MTNAFPLSFAQLRMWFLHQLQPDSAAYNVSKAFRLSGSLHIEVLERSLNEILRRHEVFRTTFSLHEDEPVQVVTSTPRPLNLGLVDLRELPLSQREPQALRLASEEAVRPFDLRHLPLIRSYLYQLDSQEYILLITIHHIIFDGWSTNVLLQELAALYNAYLDNHPSSLPVLPIQYIDYTVWQRKTLQGEVLDVQLAYWKKQLTNYFVLQLPIDRPRPVVQTYSGAGRSFVIPASMVKILRSFCVREGVTVFMALLATFQTLLQRYTNQNDIVVGSLISGRNQIETEQMIGFFANSLALRTDFSGDPTFRQLLGRVREVALGAYTHVALPFERLVEELHVARDLSRNPVFQVMFVLQNTPVQEVKLSGVDFSKMEIRSETARFDLTLEIIPGADTLSCLLQYNPDLFDPSTIERMEAHFQVLLAGILESPDSKISELPLLTQNELHNILVEWNDTKTDFHQDGCVHELFEKQVDRTPNSVAVVFENESLTYQQLNQRSNQLAHYLRELGVGPEVLVGICLERSLEMVVGLLGILKAGGAFLPLDPTYPEKRLAFILEDASPKVVLTQRRFADELPQAHGRVVRLDAEWHLLTNEPDQNPVGTVTADNLAYVIYTSGSTGQPKGVLITHRAICNRLLWGVKTHQLDHWDKLLQKASLSFDVSVWECFGPLAAGAQLILLPPGKQLDADYLLQFMKDQQVTITGFSPSALAAFLEVKGIEELKALRAILCGAEVFSYEVQERSFSRLSSELYHLYGPTETSVDATHWVCKPGRPHRTIPIGRPIANNQAYVLDSHLHPVPIGVTGELYIGGAGLARGYLNRPELTAERFLKNPFRSETDARIYRTGDLARYLPDGNIEFLGRVDHQVKIHGFRIELEEIEMTLKQHPLVFQTIVLAQEHIPGDKRLVAYVVLSGVRNSEELRSFLKERLPDYMVPSIFVMLDSFPLTKSGKIDRLALPTPDRYESGNGYVPPRGPIETSLAKIWAQVLKLERVGVHDNFFELGGHSLLATIAISRIREAFELELPVRSFFETPTVAGLARSIASVRR